MKDKLEQFILENREEFDSFDPPRADKILGKIQSESKIKRGGPNYLKFFSRAAGIALIFGLSYLLNDFIDKQHEIKLSERRSSDIYEQLPELKEAENYYSSLVSEKMNEMKPFLSDNPGIKMDITTDLTELDSIYTSLKNDLKDNVANDQIIEAMIQNYRMKLRILEDLQSEIKNENKNDYEKPKHSI
ncbi:MAG: hypothetical protein H6538_02420 [Bacteroidales bacterium]|nr:hypothetical protein [Bacteroidales bacterium]MCB8999283.1 hypothetical protein [Bacteroidales bacterium]MCB9013047.1 hypothetical protein [Bacteroidales bacterium]